MKTKTIEDVLRKAQEMLMTGDVLEGVDLNRRPKFVVSMNFDGVSVEVVGPRETVFGAGGTLLDAASELVVDCRRTGTRRLEEARRVHTMEVERLAVSEGQLRKLAEWQPGDHK